jgi:hypothetical protein
VPGCAATAVHLLIRPAAHAAEYCSDALAAAGTAATIDVLDVMTCTEALATRLSALARASAQPTTWPAATGDLLAQAGELIPRRQASVLREISPFSTNLPWGLRAMRLASEPPAHARLTIDEATNRVVDEDMAAYYRAVARNLANGMRLG